MSASLADSPPLNPVKAMVFKPMELALRNAAKNVCAVSRRGDADQNVARLGLHLDLAREAGFIAKVVGAGREQGGTGYERMNVNGRLRRR